jgi:predicted transcriptional regulator of viral defense system
MSERDAVNVNVDIRAQRRQAGLEVARLAARQSGIVTFSQLLAAGLTRHRIADLGRNGGLHRLHRGVYAVGHRKVTRDGWLTAALLAVGPGSFLSHQTAAALHALKTLNLRQIHVTAVGPAPRTRNGLVIHRTRNPPIRGELTTINGLTVSTVPRLFIELAATETQGELTRLITVAVRKRAFSHDNLERALERHATHRGIADLKAAYAAYRPRPNRKSDLELAFDELLEQYPEIPEPLRNVESEVGELDYYWPEYNVVLELDGRPYHVAVQDIERDRLKDAKLLTQGIRPLRITDQRFEHDANGSIEDLKRLLQLG